MSNVAARNGTALRLRTGVEMEALCSLLEINTSCLPNIAVSGSEQREFRATH